MGQGGRFVRRSEPVPSSYWIDFASNFASAHSNMASSLQKLEIIEKSNSEESEDIISLTGSWPAFNTLVKLKPTYLMYSWADHEYRKNLRRERLLKPRQDPFSGLGPEDIRMKFKFYPHTIMDIVALLAKDLARDTGRNNPLTPKQIVCIALYVLGHGRCKFSISQPSTSKSFSKLSSSISFRVYFRNKKRL